MRNTFVFPNCVVVTRASGPCAERADEIEMLIAGSGRQHGPESHVTKTVLYFSECKISCRSGEAR
jgi:hypothetical protein